MILGCANDLESNFFWSAMGWVQVAERQGISHKNTWKQTSKNKMLALHRVTYIGQKGRKSHTIHFKIGTD
jgi:hypothetical protein